MNSNWVAKILLRLVVVFAGSGALSLIVYAFGKLVVPSATPVDYAILGWINPDQYTPMLDEFMRATTDYGNLIVALPLISWALAYLLFLAAPKFKRAIAGLLVFELVLVLFVTYRGGYFHHNSTYLGVNLLLYAYWLVSFGVVTVIFYRMTRAQMRGFACVFLLVLLGSIINGLGPTRMIKDDVARPRPFNEANQPWNETVRKIPDEYLRGANSYPSGHTSAMFALMTPFFWYARRKSLRVGIMAWCVLQGVTRIYTAAHFPTDVMMGAFLGFGVSSVVFFALGGPWLRARAAEDDVSIIDGEPLENAYPDSNGTT